jgi:alpha-glucosidase
MRDVKIAAGEVQDPFEKNVPGRGLGRDPQRTPMQWTAERNAGFTSGEPWLPIADDYASVNVEVQRNDPGSTLSLYKTLIGLRRGEPALEIGRLEPVHAEGDVLAYIRRGRKGESDFLVALNLGSRHHVLRRPADAAAGTIALSTHLDRAGERVAGDLDLRADEGLVVRLAN